MSKDDKKKAGRPFLDIDWDKVEKLGQAGCSGNEIAAFLGIHPDTLYDRCKAEKGLTYSDYSAKNKAKGDSLLRAKQYELAMNGEKSMLVWLGKNRLGQSDKQETNDNNKPITINLIEAPKKESNE